MNLGELHADVGGLGSGLADLGSRGGERGAHHGATVDYCFDNPLPRWANGRVPPHQNRPPNSLPEVGGQLSGFRNFWGFSVPVKS
jgi:hypothetical protein